MNNNQPMEFKNYIKPKKSKKPLVTGIVCFVAGTFFGISTMLVMGVGVSHTQDDTASESNIGIPDIYWEDEFKEDDHKHYFEKWETVIDATCTSDGEERSYCYKCGEYDVRYIYATGHDGVKLEGHPATSTDDGLTEGIYCRTCGEILKEQEIIPAGSQDFEYYLWDESGYTDKEDITECVISRYHGNGGDVVIPEYINGYRVVGIGVSAFQECDNITSVQMHDGIRFIEDAAFHHCDNLQSITWGSAVTKIGEGAFQECNSLKEVYVPDSITSMGKYAFASCASLEKVTISGSLIGDHAFEGCYALKVVDIMDSVTRIGKYAFSRCEYLTNVSIPDGVEVISEGAFQECGSLGRIIIPMSVKEIGKNAFYLCRGLIGVTIEDGVTTIGEYAFAYCEGLTNLRIPGGVKTIGDYAFYCCYDLLMVSLNEGIEVIGNYAFSECNSIATITIPQSVTHIGAHAFNCQSLSVIRVMDGNVAYKDISGVLFSADGTKIVYYPRGKQNSSYTIPDGVTIIGESAFAGYNEYLTTLIIPECVVTIEREAFKGSCIHELTLPESMYEICDYAFYGSQLRKINIGTTEIIGAYAFANCELTSVTMSGNVKTIGKYAFEQNNNLTEFVYEGILQEWYTVAKGAGWHSGTGNYKVFCIDGILRKDGSPTEAPFDYTVYGDACTITGYYGKDTDVIIPEIIDGYMVIAIGENAFRDCRDITSIIISDGVQEIRDYAFFGCEALRSINIPDGARYIGEYAFGSCSSLESIVLPESIESVGDYAFSHSGLRSVTLSVGLEKISNGMFIGCPLNEVIIPEDVIAIGDYAFSDCGNLKSVTIPSNVTSIGEYAFYNCGSLETVVISEGVENIGDFAFASSYCIQSVTLPASLKNIGNNVFALSNDYSVMTEIIYGGSFSQWENDVFPKLGIVFAYDYTVTTPEGTREYTSNK